MAVRISGVTIPDNKRVEIALTYIFGIGRSLSNRILDKLKVDKNKHVKDLTSEEITKLRNEIEDNFVIEGALRRQIIMNIKRLKDIGSYRGLRHIKGLPARGQRTKSNTRTVRGNKRVTMGSGRRAVEKK